MNKLIQSVHKVQAMQAVKQAIANEMKTEYENQAYKRRAVAKDQIRTREVQNDSFMKEVLTKMKSLELFKMLGDELMKNREQFRILKFKDCDLVTEPKIQQTVYFIIKGQVNICTDERVYQRIRTMVRRIRKKRAQEEKTIDFTSSVPESTVEEPTEEDTQVDQELTLAEVENREEDEDFKTDFPVEQLTRTDYKKVLTNQTFGNDKIVTSRNFRPSFAMAQGEITLVLTIPVHVIDASLKLISNSGENLEKFNFFKQFFWYSNFSQSQRTKFNNSMKKVIFYPGQNLITEGTNNHKIYLIVDGVCNLVATKTSKAFKRLEIADDPTRAKRDAEYQKKINPYKRETEKDRYLRLKDRGSVPLEDQFGTIQHNGYISRTLKSINIGQVSTLEWVGQDLLSMDDPKTGKFCYSAIAQVKTTVYQMALKDINKIPIHIRNQLKQVAQQRIENIQIRTQQQFESLKQIKKGLFNDYEAKDDLEKTQRTKNPLSESSSTTVAHQINKLLDNQRTVNLMPQKHEKVVALERKQQKLDLKQKHVICKSFNNKSYITVEGKETHIFDQNSLAQRQTMSLLTANPRDIMLQSRITGSIFSPSQNSVQSAVVHSTKKEKIKDTISLSSADIQNYMFKSRPRDNSLSMPDIRANTDMSRGEPRDSMARQNPYVVNEVDLAQTDKNLFRSISVLDSAKQHGRKFNLLYNTQQSMEQESIVSGRSSLKQHAGMWDTPAKNYANASGAYNLLQQDSIFEQTSPLKGPKPSGAQSCSPGRDSAFYSAKPMNAVMRNFVEKQRVIEDQNPQLKSHKVISHVNEPLKKHFTLRNSFTLAPFTKKGDKCPSLVPVYKRQEDNKIAKLLPKLQSGSIIEGKYMLAKKQIEIQRQIDAQVKQMRKKSTRLLKKYGSVKAVSQVFGNDFIEMMTFAQKEQGGGKKLDQYKEELMKDNQFTKKMFQQSNLDMSVLEQAEEMKKEPVVFSFTDNKIANELLAKERLRFKIEHKAKYLHDEIEMFASHKGTRGIGDFDYIEHSKGHFLKVKIPVDPKKKEEPDFQSPSPVKRGIRGGRRRSSISLESHQSSLDGESSEEKEPFRLVELNEKISDADLQKVVIDDYLAEKLLMQDEDVADHPFLNFKEQRNLLLRPPVSLSAIKASSPAEDQLPFAMRFRSLRPNQKTNANHSQDDITDRTKCLPQKPKEHLVGMQAANPNQRQITPNPYYHAQKRKLLQLYKKQLLEKYYEEKNTMKSGS